MNNRWNLGGVIKRLFGPSPTDVAGQFNTATCMERQNLLELIMGAIDISGAPEDWDMEYLKQHLLVDGVLCITDTSMGVLPLQTGVSGINVYNRPTTCVIANPILGSFERTIGINCALIHMRYDYNGIMDIVNYYAYMLANAGGSIAVNLMNTRVAFIMECDTKSERLAMEKMYDKISEGTPAVFEKTGMFSNMHYLNPKNSYIAGDVMLLKTQLKNEFLKRFGISGLSNQKRERLVTDEVEAENAEAEYNIQHMLDTINAGFEVANRLYGLNLHASLKKYVSRETSVSDMESESGKDGEQDGNTV